MVNQKPELTTTTRNPSRWRKIPLHPSRKNSPGKGYSSTTHYKSTLLSFLRPSSVCSAIQLPYDICTFYGIPLPLEFTVNIGAPKGEGLEDGDEFVSNDHFTAPLYRIKLTQV
ncbi:hypothetical protein DY000_02037328 [Brassica cretica]|uniref:Uncharacterized protein n=1 Tax=Brassica cretica TaxID=69181 RepID=A0ABQ7BN25_BRACR|nr:hypothetical protein DY000_02037328 [Brassica cretica]